MFTVYQIVMLTLIITVVQIEGSLLNFSFYGKSILLGYLSGLVMGDVKMGLLIGGTLELMGIGLNPLGGSSVPNYFIGTVVGTAFAVATGGGMEVGIATGLPAATLGVQLDVFGKTIGSYFYHKAENASQLGDFKKTYWWIIAGFFPRILVVSTIPVLLMLVAGSAVVESVIATMPIWLLNGFRNAGNILPALGFAILMRSLPIKENFFYVLIGFVFMAYLNVPMLGIAILGLAFALLAFKNRKALATAQSAVNGDDDE